MVLFHELPADVLRSILTFDSVNCAPYQLVCKSFYQILLDSVTEISVYTCNTSFIERVLQRNVQHLVRVTLPFITPTIWNQIAVNCSSVSHIHVQVVQDLVIRNICFADPRVRLLPILTLTQLRIESAGTGLFMIPYCTNLTSLQLDGVNEIFTPSLHLLKQLCSLKFYSKNEEYSNFVELLNFLRVQIGGTLRELDLLTPRAFTSILFPVLRRLLPQLTRYLNSSVPADIPFCPALKLFCISGGECPTIEYIESKKANVPVLESLGWYLQLKSSTQFERLSHVDLFLRLTELYCDLSWQPLVTDTFPSFPNVTKLHFAGLAGSVSVETLTVSFPAAVTVKLQADTVELDGFEKWRKLESLIIEAPHIVTADSSSSSTELSPVRRLEIRENESDLCSILVRCPFLTALDVKFEPDSQTFYHLPQLRILNCEMDNPVNLISLPHLCLNLTELLLAGNMSDASSNVGTLVPTILQSIATVRFLKTLDLPLLTIPPELLGNLLKQTLCLREMHLAYPEDSFGVEHMTAFVKFGRSLAHLQINSGVRVREIFHLVQMVGQLADGCLRKVVFGDTEGGHEWIEHFFPPATICKIQSLTWE